MLLKRWKTLKIISLVWILILINCIAYGQEINNDVLIKEFENIMLIPKEERSVEQWDRAIEIIFLVYSNYDINDILELENEINKYNQIIKELELYKQKIVDIYNNQELVLSNMQESYDNFAKILENGIQNNNKNNNTFYLKAILGYTQPIGINFGIGGIYLLDNFGIGLDILLITNFNTNYNLSVLFNILF